MKNSFRSKCEKSVWNALGHFYLDGRAHFGASARAEKDKRVDQFEFKFDFNSKTWRVAHPK